MNETLDEKDKDILRILEQHADYTTRQISKKTGHPATTIHNRIQKLRKNGTIRKYTILPDYHQLDKGLLAYILITVNLQELKSKKRRQDDVLRDLLKLNAIHRADIVSGGTDIVATVRTKNVDEYNKVLLGPIQRVDGIERTQSLIVIQEGEK